LLLAGLFAAVKIRNEFDCITVPSTHSIALVVPTTMSTQQMHGILAPHDHDVLSGRGNFVNYHAGNEHFRGLVRKHKVAYVACPKPQKGKFSKMIVDEIKILNPPGRFLKQDPKTKLWYDIGEKKSLDKTRQALREGAPVIMKELTGDEEEDSSCDGQYSAPASPQLHISQPVSYILSVCFLSFYRLFYLRCSFMGLYLRSCMTTLLLAF
jgi:hypothetical protein